VVERTGVVERAAGGRPKLSVTQDLWPARQDAFPMTAALPVDGVAVAALATMATAGFALSTQTRARSRSLVVDYGVFVLFGFFAVAGVWLFFNRDSVGVEPLLQEYWLPALFAIFVLEGAMLMYFAPSEGLVPAAIVVARTTDVAPATPAQYVLILGTAVAGATVGQYLLFLLSKRWGRERLLERPWFRISDDQLARFEGWFDRWGLLAVPVSNALLFTRGMLTVPAGLAEMDDRTFVALSALGTLAFELVWAAIGLGILELGFL
jgi:membrane protein DedA with SNARE-associated domain